MFVAPLKGLGWLGDKFDRYVIDLVVDFIGRLPRILGGGLRPLQNGFVSSYALVMLVGLAVVFVSMVMMR